MEVRIPDPLDSLLADARAGDSRALGRVLDACRAYLLAVAQREMRSALQAKGGASDIVQDTYLEAQKILARFEGTTAEELLAWLRVILHNKVADFRRRFLGTEMRDLARESSLTDHLWNVLSASGQSTASHVVVRAEEFAALGAALERLPPDYRQVLQWRNWEDPIRSTRNCCRNTSAS